MNDVAAIAPQTSFSHKLFFLRRRNRKEQKYVYVFMCMWQCVCVLCMIGRDLEDVAIANSPTPCVAVRCRGERELRLARIIHSTQHV